jgi:hypothetical protein
VTFRLAEVEPSPDMFAAVMATGITVSLVFFWDALAAWLIVVVAGLLRLARGR